MLTNELRLDSKTALTPKLLYLLTRHYQVFLCQTESWIHIDSNVSDKNKGRCCFVNQDD